MSLLEHAAGWLLDATGAEQPESAAASSRKDAPASPVARRQSRLPLVALSCVCLFALLVRYGVSGGGYSGAGRPKGSPIGGDFEAQRHWMEITLNLPSSEWYTGSHPANDLQYWGLDYPPLTAYVSLACGWAARTLGVPELVELEASRGHESPAGKLFMRLSVMLCDALVAIPATILALRAINGVESSSAPRSTHARTLVIIYLALMQPAFILIDHGHFQYNCVSLGLVSLAVFFVWRGRDLSASVCFVLSLCFKQMSLYFAPAFFFYLLARTRVGKGLGVVGVGTSVRRLAILGAVVVFSFLVMFAPFLRSRELIGQVFHRMFPFARGLYEDKVANWWCASSVLVKWGLLFPRENLVRLALGSTLAAMSPSMIHIYLRPSRRAFLYALCCSGWSFFLFSFQVHEKSALLPLLPMGILLLGAHPLLAIWGGLIGTFSMYPLLEKDGQSLNYLVLQAVFAAQGMAFAGAQLLLRGPSATTATSGPAIVVLRNQENLPARIVRWVDSRPLLCYRLVQLSLFGCILVHAAALLLPARFPRYPDLASMLFVLYAAPHFAFFLLACTLHQLALPADSAEDELLAAGDEHSVAPSHSKQRKVQ